MTLESLHRRIVAMHSLWYDAVVTMDVDQVNHVERAGVLPIAFSLFHQAQLEDGAMLMIGGLSPLYDDGWATRIAPGVVDHGKHRSVEEMMGQRIGGYEAFCDYQRIVFSRTEEWVSGLEESDLDRVVMPRPFDDLIANTFSARVAGPEGVTVLDGLECWVYQHGLRHMGEIEHARALVGLGGMTS
ncbi:MAG: hypothetical protein JWM40_76 [Frankiales bacterium]|nr:hypothetical protein [Frankiales bacterium]